MNCRFCLFHNPDGEERCRQCNKRLSGDITFDGLSSAGATALAPRRRPASVDISNETDAPASPRRPTRALAATAGVQPSLFTGEHSSKVIPFPQPGPTATRLTAAKPVGRKQSTGNRTASDSQGSLDLEFLPPAPHSPRTLKTTVEASIYCDAPVASTMHRAVAAFLDSAMIFIACGIFTGIFQEFGGSVQVDKFSVTIFICSLVLITTFYGLLFAIAGRETAGQSWTELRLINFDGFPPDGQSRALRFIGCWLSFCACGSGLCWALLDEEDLTWHDHMSKTFLTPKERDTPFFRERTR